MNLIEGTYSVVFSGQAGNSLAVVNISGGDVNGKDSGGAIYKGTAVRQPDKSVKFDITVSLPTGSLGVWGSSVAEVPETRSASVAIPEACFDRGEPYTVPSYGMVVIFRRVPSDGYSAFADQNGFMVSAQQMMEFHTFWEKRGL